MRAPAAFAACALALTGSAARAEFPDLPFTVLTLLAESYEVYMAHIDPANGAYRSTNVMCVRGPVCVVVMYTG